MPLQTVSRTTLITFRSDIPPTNHVDHKSGIIHTYKQEQLSTDDYPEYEIDDGERYYYSDNNSREEHAFVWVQDKTHVNVGRELIRTLKECGFEEDKMYFIPYSSLGNWMNRYPHACPCMECNTKGIIKGTPRFQTNAPTSSSGDDSPKLLIPSSAMLLYDTERSQLHVEIYNYFSRLNSQLLKLKTEGGGRKQIRKAGVSVLGMKGLMTKLERTFKNIRKIKMEEDARRKRIEDGYDEDAENAEEEEQEREKEKEHMNNNGKNDGEIGNVTEEKRNNANDEADSRPDEMECQPPAVDEDGNELLLLPISPGKLGISLQFCKDEVGAIIFAIDATCTFKDYIEVGDRLITVDGNVISKAEDISGGNDGRVRMIGIAKNMPRPHEVVANSATLSNNPRTLMDLWEEFKYGIDGRKPAQQFTKSEKNASSGIRQLYWRRNHVWSIMDGLVGSGLTPEEACEEIREVYFEMSNTKIISAMVADKKRYPETKCHPDLYRQKEAPCTKRMAEVSFRSATLSSNPRTLHEMWREFKFGLNGRKPAQHFTRHERNANAKIKQIYYRRNYVWALMDRLVRSGDTPEQACQKIRGVYGKMSMTKMISAIIADKKRYSVTKCHPDLE
mmetsp:Transcript_38375/g.80445  ORF Transcript_38375/g.80445 Transcript_38375/m.80445 type:complete len:617 (+) Transcript_38375:105-1955(+)